MFIRLAVIAVLALAAALAHAAAPEGAQLYQRNCAVCHGDAGSGGVGVPLAQPEFLATVGDDYLTRTIRLGRPGRVMPGFSQLSDAQVGAIVRYIRSWPHPPAVPMPKLRADADAAHGKTLYAERCAACHGANGEGGHGTGVTFSRARDLPIIAPALNNAGFLAAATDEMIKATLMNGRTGTPMVSFLKQGLSERDIDDIVAYVRAYERETRRHADAVLEASEPVLIFESAYSLEETVENVKRAAEGRNFRLIRDQYLDEGFVEAGKEDKRRVMVYFCNFKFLYDAMALDPRVGLFLPCRVTVVEQDGKVQVMSINPKRLSALFNNAELNRACEEMYRLYQEILEEATL